VLIVVIVIFINILLLTGIFIQQSQFAQYPFQQGDASAESITRSFSKEIVMSESGMAITVQGQETLERNHAWVQILDGNGNQVYRYRVPTEAKTKYTPLDIVQTYKYMEKELMSTVF